jgi:hypothetical protein
MEDLGEPAMNGWLELEEKRNFFLGCLRAAMFYPLGALALLLFLKAPPANGQQVTPVPPFVGTNSETWERFGVRSIPSGTSILGGIATISGDHMETATSFFMCTVVGVPSDGSILMDQDRPDDLVTISFSQPVSAFGAYWGSGVNCYFGDAPSILTFQDVNGNVIGTDSFFYMGNGALMWHGYRFGTPVKTITRAAGDGREGVAIDGLQATVGTNPAFFNGETALGGGWYYLQFPNGTPFGYYSYLSDQNYIYHLDLAFEYLIDANDANHGIYFYDFVSSSFFYTSPSDFPYLYDFSLNAWLYYLPDASNPGRYSQNPRWFYNFATGQWINL